MSPRERTIVEKPRAAFCWECGLQLYQRKLHVTRRIDDHERILHLNCARWLDRVNERGCDEEE